MRYYLIAGERSGDLHTANLMKAIRQEDPQAVFRAWGGDEMQAAGATLVKHYKDLAFMGFWEVIKNLHTIKGFLKTCQKDILQWNPDVVILVDYAGFNMRIARFCKEHHIKNYYYISPKVWAWNQSRALKIKKYVDRMFVIFPFETEFFKKYEYAVDYVGNPLLDAIADFTPNPDFRSQHHLTHAPIIALLPGSRKQEVQQMLPVMLKAAALLERQKPGVYQYVIGGVSNLPPDLYQSILSNSPLSPSIITNSPQGSVTPTIAYDQSYDILAQATAAMVTSGTATLETALFEVPQVVCYRTSAFSYRIAKALIRIPYIGLVNLVGDKLVAVELIQDTFTPENTCAEINNILPGSPAHAAQQKDYQAIKQRMGEPGASAHAAKLMVKYLKEK